MEALNFGEGGMPQHSHYAKKSRGALFAFSASSYSLLTSDNLDASVMSPDHAGIDTFVSEICRSNHQDGHMDTLIAYSLHNREKYQGIYNFPPKNKADALLTLSKSQKKSPPGETSSVMSNDNNTPSVMDVTVISSDDATSSEKSSSFPAASNGVGSVVASGLGPDMTVTSSFTTPNKKNGVTFDVDQDYSVDHDTMPQDPLVNTTIDNFRTATAIRAFLKELFTGVCGQTPVMCLRLQQVNSPKLKSMMSFLKFLDENKDSAEEELYANFLAVPLYATSLTCSFLIPFQDDDRYNIVPDGYCFYRTLFQLLLRAYNSEFLLSAKDMKEQDRDIKLSEKGGRREAFHKFFNDLETLLPECYGKSRVLNAQITFFNLKSQLDEAFWGILDAVAFVDFPCSGFSYLRDKSLPGYWAKYRCSSIFSLENGRETVNEDSVGCAPTLAEVAQLLRYPPNFIMHKINHYFVSDHPSQAEFWVAFESSVKQMLVEMQRRINVSSSVDIMSDEVALNFSDVFDRCCGPDGAASTRDDETFMRAATKLLLDDLNQREIRNLYEEELTPPNTILKSNKRHSPVSVTNIDNGSSQPAYALLEQSVRFYLYLYMTFLTILQFVEQFSELESLKEELEALKRMIIINAVARENPVQLLDGNDSDQLL
jgi:hypothetical protein